MRLGFFSTSFPGFDMARLNNKVALVTGGGGGIGMEIASTFCREGATVFLLDSNPDNLAQAIDRVAGQVPGARISGRTADVSSERSVDEAIAAVLADHGRLDVLVNNAAIRNYTALASTTYQEWEAMLKVNLFGASNMARAALPALRESKAGSIVNVASCYAVSGRKGMGIYDSTKAAMLAFTRTLAFEEAEHGVRVNVVCPGSTLTDFHIARAAAKGVTAEQLSGERKDTSMLGRWARPEEIALPILWLASDEASYITGTTLMVDAGLHAM